MPVITGTTQRRKPDAYLCLCTSEWANTKEGLCNGCNKKLCSEPDAVVRVSESDFEGDLEREGGLLAAHRTRLEVIQKKCTHPNDRVTADILEGAFDVQVLWCQVCGSYRFNYEHAPWHSPTPRK